MSTRRFAAFVLGLFMSCSPASAQVTTSQYDNACTGADLNESVLTPANVNVNQFGKVFSFRVDGPLILLEPGSILTGLATARPWSLQRRRAW